MRIFPQYRVILQIDAEIAEKVHYRMETAYRMTNTGHGAVFNTL